jgi:hypothetical protein
MLVENTEPCHRSIGHIYIQPGCNTVKDSVWEKLMDNGYRKSVGGLIEAGILIVHESLKPTQALVAKTYDLDLLEDWLTEAKGPLKGAIKKQIAILSTEDKAG